MNVVAQLIETVRKERRLDPRTSVFDVRAERRNGSLALVGETTERSAVEDLLARLALAGRTSHDEIVRLPEESLGTDTAAIVRVAIAPLYEKPQLASAMISQVVLGTALQILSRRDRWNRVRG